MPKLFAFEKEKFFVCLKINEHNFASKIPKGAEIRSKL